VAAGRSPPNHCCSSSRSSSGIDPAARAPNLTSLDRCVLGRLTLFIKPRRMPKLSAIVKSSTLFKLHKTLVERKYRLLFLVHSSSVQARSERTFG